MANILIWNTIIWTGFLVSLVIKFLLIKYEVSKVKFFLSLCDLPGNLPQRKFPGVHPRNMNLYLKFELFVLIGISHYLCFFFYWLFYLQMLSPVSHCWQIVKCYTLIFIFELNPMLVHVGNFG